MELDLNKNNGEVTYLDEIVGELSKEFDMDSKEIYELCSLSLDYVKKLTKEKDTMAVLLPYLGVLHFNRSLGRFFKRQYSKANRNSLKVEVENLEHRLEKTDKLDNKKIRKRPFLYKFKRILDKKKLPLPKKGVTLGQKEFWTTVATIQNEINNR